MYTGHKTLLEHQQALEVLIETSSAKYTALAHRIMFPHGKNTGGVHTAEDAFSHACMRAYVGLPKFKGDAALSTWFHRIIINAAKIMRRKNNTKLAQNTDGLVRADDAGNETTYDLPSKDPNQLDAMVAAIDVEMLQKARRKLSAEHQEALRLRHDEELSMNEMSAALGVPLSTVKSRLSQARRALKFEVLKERVAKRAKPITAVPGVTVHISTSANEVTGVVKKQAHAVAPAPRAGASVKKSSAKKSDVVSVKIEPVILTRTEIGRALAGLSDDLQEVVLFRRGGMPVDRIALIVQMTPQEVSEHLALARKTLADNGYSPGVVNAICLPQEDKTQSTRQTHRSNRQYLAAMADLHYSGRRNGLSL